MEGEKAEDCSMSDPKVSNTAQLFEASAIGDPALLEIMLGDNVGTSLAVTDHQHQTVLHRIMRKPLSGYHSASSCQKSEKPNYEECLDLILDCEQFPWSSLINKQDSLGNTALHYAGKFWDQDTVTKLLLKGANIGLRNNHGEAPISKILPATIENILNEHCIECEGNPTSEEFKLTFNYDFLAPAKTRVTAVISSISRSDDHQHLLKHPVINSFLELKWRSFSLLYNLNILFYALLVIALTTYIFLNYAGHSVGVSPPVCPGNVTEVPGQPWGNSPAASGIVLCLLSLFIIKEFNQFVSQPKQYFFNCHNWHFQKFHPKNFFEITLIVLGFILLLYGHPGCNIELKRQISSVVLLISWFLVLTMIGRHPWMSLVNIYSTMFYKVVKTFASFLAWYSLFIIAFALSFYILLHKDTGNAAEEYFDDVGFTLIKTFTMFTGELDFNDIPFNSHFSYGFFLFFLFLIVVVLMNLLNGLAVSDTGAIWKEAERQSHLGRLKTIAQFDAGFRLFSGQEEKKGKEQEIENGGASRTTDDPHHTALNIHDNRLEIYPNKQDRTCCLPYFQSEDEIFKEIVEETKNIIFKLNEEKKMISLAVKLDEVITTLKELKRKKGRVLMARNVRGRKIRVIKTEI